MLLIKLWPLCWYDGHTLLLFLKSINDQPSDSCDWSLYNLSYGCIIKQRCMFLFSVIRTISKKKKVWYHLRVLSQLKLWSRRSVLMLVKSVLNKRFNHNNIIVTWERLPHDLSLFYTYVVIDTSGGSQLVDRALGLDACRWGISKLTGWGCVMYVCISMHAD